MYIVLNTIFEYSAHPKSLGIPCTLFERFHCLSHSTCIMLHSRCCSLVRASQRLINKARILQ